MSVLVVEALVLEAVCATDDVQVRMETNAGIEHGDVDVDRSAPVPRPSAAAFAVDAVDSRRKALRSRVGRAVADRERKHLAVLGDESDSRVGFNSGERGRREA